MSFPLDIDNASQRALTNVSGARTDLLDRSPEGSVVERRELVALDGRPLMDEMPRSSLLDLLVCSLEWLGVQFLTLTVEKLFEPKLTVQKLFGPKLQQGRQ